MRYTSEHGVSKFQEFGIHLNVRYITSGMRFFFIVTFYGRDLITWDIPIATLLHKLGVSRRDLSRALDHEEFLANQELIEGISEK